MPSNFKSSPFNFLVAGAVLVSFLAVIFFSLPAMTAHGADTMSETCLFPATGAILCSTNSLTSVFHHIASYQSFLNAPSNFLNLGISFVLLLLTLIGLTYLRLRDLAPPRQKNFSQNLSFQLWRSQPERLRLRRWLSFLTNSPALT